MAQFFHKQIWVNLICRINRKLPQGRIFGPHFAAVFAPGRNIKQTDLCGQSAEKISRIRANGQIGADRWLFKFGRVNIHHYFFCIFGKIFPVITHLADIIACAHAQYYISVLQGKVPSTLAYGADTPRKQRVIRRN